MFCIHQSASWGFDPVISEENGLQDRCKQRATLHAKEKNKEAGQKPRVDESQFANIGLLGLGDANYAIDSSMFSQIAKQKHFVKKGAVGWRTKHSEPHASDAVEPSSTIFRQCTSYCLATAREENNLDPDILQKSKGLLLLVNRHMRDLYGLIKKQIDQRARRPLLFVRALLSDGTFEWRAWILTRAVFKPRSIDGVAVYPRATDTDAEELRVPFAVSLELLKLEGSDITVPAFSCMDEISVEITALQSLYPEAQLQYCYNPAYVQSSRASSLTELHVTELAWIPVDGSCAPDSSDPDDDHDENSDDLSEIENLVSDLMSVGADKKEPAKKTRSAQRRTGSANTTSAPGEFV